MSAPGKTAGPGPAAGPGGRALEALRAHPGHAIGLVLATLLVGAALLPPVRDAFDGEQLQRWIEAIRSGPAGWAGVVGAFWLAAAVGVPVTAMIAGIAAIFEPRASIAMSLVGVAGSASLGFGAGRLFLAGDPEEQLDGRLGRIADRVLDRGVLSLALLRNIPIAPYALVNLACGATRLRLAHFLTGTLAGMAPGIVLASAFGRELAAWFEDPSPAGVARMGLVVALMIGVATLADRVLRRREARHSDERGDA